MSTAAGILPHVIAEHAAEVAALYHARRRLMTLPDVDLDGIRQADDRIDAHMDGLAVAQSMGWDIRELLGNEREEGETFVAAAMALEHQNISLLEELLSAAVAEPEQWRELLAGFGWVVPQRLRGIVVQLLGAEQPSRRLAGVAACALHRVDPGVATAVNDQDATVRARALRAAGELGKRELLSFCARATADEDAACRFWAAWSAVLLGDRERALDHLETRALGPEYSRAFTLVLQALPMERSQGLLQRLAREGSKLHQAIRGIGYVGDPRNVPWLIAQMNDDRIARAAGEAFSLITGLDLSRPPFERPRPDVAQDETQEDPNETDVSMDEDDGLAWPDPVQVQAWWNQNGSRFTIGARHFMGAPPTADHCRAVLRTGYQRQRIAAAHYLSLAAPGTPLFEWRAPAWRQQRELNLIA